MEISIMTQRKTIREITGEVWAEINHAHWQKGFEFDMDNQKFFLKITQGVLARYEKLEITNDEDFPIQPLPVVEP